MPSSHLKNAAMVPARPSTAYVLLQDKARPDRGATREGIAVERAVPMDRVVVRKRAPRAVPVKRACAKGPPARIEGAGVQQVRRIV